MAITIEQNPEEFAPVFNPMNFVCSSDNVNSTTYWFYLVKVKDDGGNVIYQNRYVPRFNDTLLRFDVQRALESYVSYDITGITTGTTGVRRTSNVFKEYTVQFVEESGSTASGVASGASTTSGTKFAYNGSFTFNDFVSYNDTDYLIATTGTKKFMTDMRGGNIRIKTGQRFELGIMTAAGASQPVKNIVVKTYGISGSLLGTYKIANSFSAGTTTPDKFLSVLVGTGDLNSTTLGSGSQPVITDSVYTYTVQVENNSAAIVSETLTFEIDRRCYMADEVRLYWLNSLGRIDSFNFNFASDVSMEVVKSTFRKLNGSMSGSTFSYTRHETGLTNFYTESNQKLKIRTDYITNIEAEWLQNFVSSPIHWAEVDGNIVSVVLDTKTYNVQTIEKNKLFSVEFDLTFANSDYRQRL